MIQGHVVLEAAVVRTAYLQGWRPSRMVVPLYTHSSMHGLAKSSLPCTGCQKLWWKLPRSCAGKSCKNKQQHDGYEQAVHPVDSVGI